MPDQWLNLVATKPAEFGFTRFEFKELSFLLQKGEATTFANVMLEEQRFHVVMGLIGQRSQLVLDEVFPRLSNADIRVGEQRPIADIEAILGISITHQLKEFTADIVSHVDEDVDSVKKTFVELRAAIQKIYPERKLVDVKFQ